MKIFEYYCYQCGTEFSAYAGEEYRDEEEHPLCNICYDDYAYEKRRDKWLEEENNN